ncbi:segregation and condensation protein B [Micromonospora kangleipakensis]|uniref:Segregation and condensation protein B n=1 Tax=Micromonospora kangleipakensis TaxID=1077942 RepID=A0A4Q8BAU8_9ACTN|nr:SMC-Scp complex subunit ScpB [Micromonospora kangleipakensis]RZU74890.1 segregation and condensation protein B [Micromonospora kangleipakensis]
MSDEERRDSLADQAAAWVPPWERRPTPAPDSPAEDLGDELPLQGPKSAMIPAQPAATAPAESPDQVPSAVDAPPPAPADEPAAVPTEPAGEPAGQGEPAGEGAAAAVPRKQAAGRRRVTAAPEPAPELGDAELRGALEAILLVVDEPVSELALAEVLEQPAERVGPMLDEIAAGYTAAGHGFELRRAAGGWRLYTRPEYATYVERFVLDGQSARLTQAALETLAVIAYKQPVTRSRISAIRGVNCDGVIRTLVSRGLVEECGTEPDSGAFLYRTTTMFLEKLGLNSVADLPPLAPFLPDDVEELADATR